MTGPHKSRKAGPCDGCSCVIAAGDDYYAGKAKCFGWRTRFATERRCVYCAANNRDLANLLPNYRDLTPPFSEFSRHNEAAQ